VAHDRARANASKQGLITPPPPHHFSDRILFIASQPVACLSFHTTFRAHLIFLMASGIDWAQACIAAINRPLSERRQGSNAANVVAVSHFTLPDRCVASRRLLTLSNRFRPALLLPFSVQLSFCWITGCCYGGAAAKRWMGTEFGVIYDDSAAGCLQAAWRESFCFPSTCSQ
jgi:hypothetical protein